MKHTHTERTFHVDFESPVLVDPSISFNNPENPIKKNTVNDYRLGKLYKWQKYFRRFIQLFLALIKRLRVSAVSIPTKRLIVLLNDNKRSSKILPF